ncbi:MAG: hypothetical protein AAFQ36_14285 [Pseudomonadota bacterium]
MRLIIAMVWVGVVASGCTLGELIGAYSLPTDTPEVEGPFPPLAGAVEGVPAPLSVEERAELEAELDALAR